jgi:NADP-dependent 3-hydroxy acid dehydrogenase YdfG
MRDEDVKAALDKTVETFGRLDFAFNNASVEQAIASAAELKEEEWDHRRHRLCGGHKRRGEGRVGEGKARA